MKQGIEEHLQSKHVDTRPIEGFRVMEWLRGVRDANHTLSINDLAAYKRKREGMVLVH